ncbi:hypothetical protein [Kalamiella sp. sgz302252]|uniref:hypothetical protein n=1 Tax=Pantoea sp. sgz302252 TaxID=3341827 RepID=UPI0036D22AAA
MYSEVTITDNSYLVTIGYEIISIIIAFLIFLLSSKKIFSLKAQWVIKILAIFIAGCAQYYLAKYGADYIYRLCGYSAWDDTTIRFSALFFTFIYVLFGADWKDITSKNNKVEKNKP